MFTGIIESLGKVSSVKSQDRAMRLEISAHLAPSLNLGASISVNGCCLTCVEQSQDFFAVDVVLETLRCTTFSDLKAGDLVNLERPLAFNGRLDGHLVLGHVDAIGEIAGKKNLPDGSTEVTIKAPAKIMRYLIEKGSIAVDGVSLTVWNVTDDAFTFAMIPFTAANTTLGFKGPQEKVNLEVDLFAKYVEKLASGKGYIS